MKISPSDWARETRYYMDITLSRILELMQNEGLTAHQLEVRAGLSPSAKANMPQYIVACWLILYNI